MILPTMREKHVNTVSIKVLELLFWFLLLKRVKILSKKHFFVSNAFKLDLKSLLELSPLLQPPAHALTAS